MILNRYDDTFIGFHPLGSKNEVITMNKVIFTKTLYYALCAALNEWTMLHHKA